jgi:hypothetical protein
MDSSYVDLDALSSSDEEDVMVPVIPEYDRYPQTEELQCM